MKIKNLVINTLALLWNAIWRSQLFGTFWNLLIVLVIFIPTSGMEGIISVVPIAFLMGLGCAPINALLLFVIGSGLFFLPKNTILLKFIFTALGAALSIKFGREIMLMLTEKNKIIGEISFPRVQALPIITAISYGIANYQFAVWYQRNMYK